MRPLPEDIESERALLATICAPGAERAAEEIAPALSPDDFVHPAHKAILKAVQALVFKRGEINPLTLKDELDNNGDLSRVGGYAGLIEIMGDVEVGRPRALVDILAKKRKLRALIRMGAGLIDSATEETEPDEIIEAACSALAGMALSTREDGPVVVGNLTDECVSQIMAEAAVTSRFGLRTGFYRFDGITRGLKPGELIILAARPGVGKSTLALNWALRSAQRNTIALFSLEMSKEELTRKLLTDASGLDLRNLNTRDQEQMETLNQAKRDLDSLPIHIDDRSGINVRQIRTKVERLQARGSVGLVIVDYLQLLTSVDRNTKQNETNRIGEISRELKIMAKDCKVPVLVLSQLNRDVEKRTNGKPQLSDLRDSGCIEQDADLVVFINRKIVPGLSPELQDKAAELHIAKHRNGPCGSVPLTWAGELSRYTEVERGTGGIPEPEGYVPGHQSNFDYEEV